MSRLVQLLGIVLVILQVEPFTSAAFAIEPTSFREEISPLLRKRCGNCHNAETRRGQLDLSSFNSLRAGSAGGPIAIAGKPDESMMYLTVARKTTPTMPPGNRPLPASEVQRIRDWIALGMPETPEQAVQAAASLPTSIPTTGTSDSTNVKLEAMKDKAIENAKNAANSSSEGSETPGLNEPSRDSKSDSTESKRNVTTALAMSPDGQSFAMSSQGAILIRSTTNNQAIRSIPFPGGDVFELRFTHDGKRLLAAGGTHVDSANVVVLDCQSGKVLFDRSEIADIYLTADLSPDSRLMAVGGPMKKLEVISTLDNRVLHQMSKHTDWVLSTSFSPDGLLIASGDRAGNLFVYESESGIELHSLRGHKSSVIAQGWLDAGDFLVTADANGQVFVWNMHNGELVSEWMAHEKGNTDLHVSENVIATGGRDSQVRFWDRTGKSIASPVAMESLPLKVRLHASSRTLAVGDWSGQLSLHELKDLVSPPYVPSPLLLAAATPRSRIETATTAANSLGHGTIASNLISDVGSLDSRLSMSLHELALAQESLSTERAALLAEMNRIEGQLQMISERTARGSVLAKAIEDYLQGVKNPKGLSTEPIRRTSSLMAD